MNNIISRDQKFQNLLDHMCDDIIEYIKSYLPLRNIIRHCIYLKYYNEKKIYDAMQVFTTKEINIQFHADDLFGMSTIKDLATIDYIRYNLENPKNLKILYKQNGCILEKYKLINNEAFVNLRKIIICSKYRIHAIQQKNKLQII